MTTYRLVSDYGYGDINWLVEGLTEQKAIEAFNEQTGQDATTLDQCEKGSLLSSFYYVEEETAESFIWYENRDPLDV